MSAQKKSAFGFALIVAGIVSLNWNYDDLHIGVGWTGIIAGASMLLVNLLPVLCSHEQTESKAANKSDDSNAESEQSRGSSSNSSPVSSPAGSR